MHKGECILPKSKKNILKFVLPITISGILIIALALAVGIILYRKKDVATKMDREEKEYEYPVDKGHKIL
jgi:hypothetical protein